jgi:hypothetical protein
MSHFPLILLYSQSPGARRSASSSPGSVRVLRPRLLRLQYRFTVVTPCRFDGVLTGLVTQEERGIDLDDIEMLQ